MKVVPWNTEYGENNDWLLENITFASMVMADLLSRMVMMVLFFTAVFYNFSKRN